MSRMTVRGDAAWVWMIYRGGWGYIGTLSWTTAAVYFIRDAGMSPFQLVLAGTFLEVTYFCVEIPTAVVADLYSRRLSMIVAAVVSGLSGSPRFTSSSRWSTPLSLPPPTAAKSSPRPG